VWRRFERRQLLLPENATVSKLNPEAMKLLRETRPLNNNAKRRARPLPMRAIIP